MSELGGTNIEISRTISEEYKHTAPQAGQWVEIVEAVILALVAIATAWSGYQAARWSGIQVELYGESTKIRVTAQGLELKGGQQRLYDSSVVTEWIKATMLGEKNLAQFFERRFRAEFRPAFETWRETDPTHNPSVPAAPTLTEEYHNANLDEAAKLDEEASALFERGTKSRERSDDYVRVTVYLATVLLLTAIGQRFRIKQVRVGLAGLGTSLLCIALWRILTLPRL